MHHRVLWTASLLVAPLLLSSGCASIVGTAYAGPRIYTGTRIDIGIMGESGCREHLRWLGAVDLPFSFAVDTVLLPVTLPIALGKALDRSSRGSGSPPAAPTPAFEEAERPPSPPPPAPPPPRREPQLFRAPSPPGRATPG